MIPGWEAALLLLCVQAPAAHAECSPRKVCWTWGGRLHLCLPASPGTHHISCFFPAAFRQARPQGVVGPVGRQQEDRCPGWGGGTTSPPKAGPCVGGAQGRRGSSGSSGGYERPMISCHFYLEPTQSFSVAIFTQCSHLITPSLSVVSLHLASKFFFPKSSEVSRSAAARGSAIYKQVLPLTGAKTSITTHLPTVPLKRAIPFATRSQPGKHLRVQTLSKGKKPCAAMELRRPRN